MMSSIYARSVRSNELYHFGVLGMKWGVRRYQNSDGTLTAAGKKHYDTGETKKIVAPTLKPATSNLSSNTIKPPKAKSTNETKEPEKKKGLSDKQKKAITVGAAVAGTALAAYGAYRVGKAIKLDKAKYEFTRQLVDDYNYDKMMSTRVGAAPPNTGFAFMYRTDQLQKLGNLDVTRKTMDNFKKTEKAAKSSKIVKDELRRYRDERAKRLAGQLRYFT